MPTPKPDNNSKSPRFSKSSLSASFIAIGIDAETVYPGVFHVIADDFIPLNYSEVDFNISWGYSTTAPCEGDCVQQANLLYEAIIGQPSECSIGDVNSDGNIDVTDIIRQVNIIINLGASPSESELCASDVNVDGSVNVLDVLYIVDIIMNGTSDLSSGELWAAELNNDGSIDIFDLILLVDYIMSGGSSARVASSGGEAVIYVESGVAYLST